MFKGSIVPLITPFTKQNKVDHKALYELVEWHVAEGTDGIICLGTTGEAPTLDHKERTLVVKTCQKAIKGRIPLIVGTGTYNTAESVAFTELVKEMKVDAAMAIVPYYNKPTPRGCLEHFRAISKVGLPVMLYHHPGRTGLKLSTPLFLQMIKEKIIHAIKDCSWDYEQMKEILREFKIPIMSGDNEELITTIKLGGTGGVCTAPNVIPKEWKEITALALKKDFAAAEKKVKELDELLKGIQLEGNPGPIKYLVHLIGKCEPNLRLPMVMPEEKTRKTLHDYLLKRGLLPSLI
ncbi:MAG TPA: 4-hydroxy-tetrahydrodipicolinate synthase [Chlamydiales bacterium]|nr:4-hydroxy-tetrahydrodipicolinate synthase [Chlamydiales bacterium]